MLKVINIWGGPGAGKSTTAAGLFNLMKTQGHNVELVSEYAKDLTWSKDWQGLSNQLLILGQQDQRLRRLVGQVEWVITDSPLPTGIAYMGDSWKPWLEDATWACFDQYINFDVLLHRQASNGFQKEGRNQTHEEAMVLDNVLDNLWHTAGIEDDMKYSLEVPANVGAPYVIHNWLMEFKGEG
jgi:hypothetical protein